MENKMPATQTEAVAIFEKFINQRPGLEVGNYGTDRDGPRAYREEQASIREQKGRAIEALRTFEGLPYDAEMLKGAMRHAFSGRLQFNEKGELDYCTGQYWPTEYRAATATCLEQYISDMRQSGVGIPAIAVVPLGETITVEVLKAINVGHGGHFFDTSTMDYFKSKVHAPVYCGSDGWLFVTSEQQDDDAKRGYTVRKMGVNGDMTTIGEYEEYETLRLAQKVARQLAEQSKG
jgi:hypothetical protein